MAKNKKKASSWGFRVALIATTAAVIGIFYQQFSSQAAIFESKVKLYKEEIEQLQKKNDQLTTENKQLNIRLEVLEQKLVGFISDTDGLAGLVKEGESLLLRAQGKHVDRSPVTKEELDRWREKVGRFLASDLELRERFEGVTYNNASALDKKPFLKQGLKILKGIGGITKL